MKSKAATVFDKFVAWLLFEKPYTAYSFDDTDAVLARIQANIGPANGPRRRGSLPPFKGYMRPGGGVFRYSKSAPRALKCVLVSTPDGTRLDGTLSLYGYERLQTIGFPAIFSLMIVFSLIFGHPEHDGVGKSLLITTVLLIFWIVFNRFATKAWLWFMRGRERAFLDFVEKVVQIQILRPPPTSELRPPSPPTPTEVFIRPRHS